MASYHSGQANRVDHQAGAAGLPSGTDEIMAPIIAGAYARGVADTLDLLGIPGVFLDRGGEVIFASKAAAPLLRGPLQMHVRHLVAKHADDNRILGHFIADAVGEANEADAVRLPGAALELRRLPHTEASALPGQMVRAVLVLADETNPRQAAALQLLA